MKLDTLLHPRAGAVAVCLVLLVAATGCGSNPSSDPAALARTQEKERLQTENQELAQVRAEHEEVQRLKQENQELPKMRSQYQEVARLKKDNDVLRQQIAKISPAAATNLSTGADGANAAGETALALQDAEKAAAEAALAAGAIHEGDEILVEPKNLKQILPDFDWDKLQRTEALAVRSLLEKDGLQITNISQLLEAGITNFVLRRAMTNNILQQGNPAPVP